MVAPCRGSASGNGEPRPKNRKMTGYPPMTQPSTSFEVETDCAAREERRILAGRECGMRYHPALRPCFAHSAMAVSNHSYQPAGSERTSRL